MTTSINFNFSNNDVRNNAYYAMIVIVPGFATECIRVNSISFCFAFPKFKDFHLPAEDHKRAALLQFYQF